MEKLALFLARLRRDRLGATGILVGGSLMALAGTATMVIDVGSVYLAKRKLQGVADTAALTAASGDIAASGRADASHALAQYAEDGIEIETFTPGDYTADRTVRPDDRFGPATGVPTAARVVLRQEVPTFFSAILTGRSGMTIRAEAIAAKKDEASFALGTRLAQLSGGMANKVLSQLAGTQLNLSVLDMNGLATAEVDVLHFADALRLQAGGGDGTYGEVFARQVPVSDVVRALGAATPDSRAGLLLAAIAGKLANRTIRPSDLIDLGPLSDRDSAIGQSGIRIDTYSLLRSALELLHGDSYVIELEQGLPDLAEVDLTIVGGSAMRNSPLLTVTSARAYELRTSQARIYLKTQVRTGSLGLTAVNLPIYVELAEARARLTAIQCMGDTATDGVTLSVTPSVGTLAIADVTLNDIGDLGNPPAFKHARILATPLANITGYSKVSVGGVTPQSVRFSMAEVEARSTRTARTNDMVQGIATSLIRDLDLDVQALGLNLGLGSLVSSVGTALSGVAPPLDALLDELTNALGLKLGSADVRINHARCGVPQLVS